MLSKQDKERMYLELLIAVQDKGDLITETSSKL